MIGTVCRDDQSSHYYSSVFHILAIWPSNVFRGWGKNDFPSTTCQKKNSTTRLHSLYHQFLLPTGFLNIFAKHLLSTIVWDRAFVRCQGPSFQVFSIIITSSTILFTFPPSSMFPISNKFNLLFKTSTCYHPFDRFSTGETCSPKSILILLDSSHVKNSYLVRGFLAGTFSP